MIKKAISLSALLLTSQMPIAIAAEVPNVVDSFETIFGVTEGKRRNHTKGFCFNATLTPHDLSITQFTNSPIFTEEVNVTGRFSHGGGNNHAADDKAGGKYGMGLSITTSSGELHLMALNTLDFFPVATPEAFAELMYAKSQGGDAVKAFKEKNTDLQRFKAHMSKKKVTLTPYEGNTYNSVNSFYLVNAAGEKTAIRWSFVPSQNESVVVEPKPDFFFDNMQQNLNDHDLVWDMVVTIANPDDDVDNPSIPWEGDNKKIIAAKLKISSIDSDELGGCDNINFDPLVLSSGFAPSADPMLQARRNAYAISFGKRLSEKQ
jgi:catalase